jgi:hypothetical protein
MYAGPVSQHVGPSDLPLPSAPGIVPRTDRLSPTEPSSSPPERPLPRTLTAAGDASDLRTQVELLRAEVNELRALQPIATPHVFRDGGHLVGEATAVSRDAPPPDYRD